MKEFIWRYGSGTLAIAALTILTWPDAAADFWWAYGAQVGLVVSALIGSGWDGKRRARVDYPREHSGASVEVEQEQCSTAILDASGSAPERCALKGGHEGGCEP